MIGPIYTTWKRIWIISWIKAGYFYSLSLPISRLMNIFADWFHNYSKTSHIEHLYRSTPSLYRPAFHITRMKSTVSFLYLWKFCKSTTSIKRPYEFIPVNGRFRVVLLYLSDRHAVEYVYFSALKESSNWTASATMHKRLTGQVKSTRWRHLVELHWPMGGFMLMGFTSTHRSNNEWVNGLGPLLCAPDMLKWPAQSPMVEGRSKRRNNIQI